MRTASFIGSWIAGLVALALAATLFTQWLGFALGTAAGPTSLFLWMAFGVNLLVWSSIGALRAVDESTRALLRRGAEPSGRGTVVTRGLVDEHEPRDARVLAHASAGGGSVVSARGDGHGEMVDAPTPHEGTAAPWPEPDRMRLAVIIPAHNEEPVIDAAITSALRLFNRWDIFVVSDSSRDSTADIAAETGINVLELLSNRGKAGAIEAVIQEFGLTDNYDGVVILDADTELDEKYVEGAQRQLADPSVAAVAGFVEAEWKPEERTIVGRLISAYRDRLYWMLQYLLRFGQTWRYTSTTFIVPGFASVYRSSVLKQLDINPKGLVIEDFNMTFEVHHRRLGRISMHPGTKARCQDPFTLGDYVKQVRRWTLGFWQTVRLHGVWPSLFWFALFFYIMEILLIAVMLIVTVGLGVFTVVPEIAGDAVLDIGPYATGYTAVTAVLPLTAIAVGLFVPDYVLTCVMAAIRRRPSYLLYGLFFLPMRLIDSYLTLRTIPQAWTARSDGQWKSPVRFTGGL